MTVHVVDAESGTRTAISSGSDSDSDSDPEVEAWASQLLERGTFAPRLGPGPAPARQGVTAGTTCAPHHLRSAAALCRPRVVARGMWLDSPADGSEARRARSVHASST
jgi:hypothetical protein